MAALNIPARSRRSQAGYTLLLVLFTMTALLFGALFTMRGTILQTVMAGNTLQHQKNQQASDMALRLVENLIITTSQGAGSTPLEISAGAGQPWYYTPTTTPWTVPSTTFWSSCIAASQCGSIANVPNGYQVYAVVVPSNLPVDPYNCGTSGLTAVYYDIFLSTMEPNFSSSGTAATTSSVTESIFKLCVVSA
ncbi:MAG: hypothetical protein JOY60_09040 [Burkholderiaceae bacterium]|nr:hypothetical protein [Burkholderiaceae bacterium]